MAAARVMPLPRAAAVAVQLQRPLGSSRDQLMAAGGVPRSPAKRPELVEAGLL